MPKFPFDGFSNKIFSRLSTRPEHFFSFISLLSIVDRPAESYPLYSSFFNASIMFPDTGLELAIPIIPHIN